MGILTARTFCAAILPKLVRKCRSMMSNCSKIIPTGAQALISWRPYRKLGPTKLTETSTRSMLWVYMGCFGMIIPYSVR